MKITPLEIRQKAFEKGFRGYEKEEVNAYLQSLSVEWEKMQDENAELKKKVDDLHKEVDKLREVESSLYKTLKTAEDTGANMIDQANKMAEIHIKETEVRAEAVLNDAKNKAHDTIEEAEMISRQTIEEMEDQLKNLMHAYKNLENLKEDLMSDLKGLSSDVLERVERFRAQSKKINIEDFYMQARRESKKVIEDRLSENSRVKQQQAGVRPEKAEVNPVAAPPPVESQEEGNSPSFNRPAPSPNEFTSEDEETSFFDEID